MTHPITSRRNAVLAAGVLSLAALGLGTAGAQPAQQTPTQTQQAAPGPATSSDVDEMTLAKFVDAYQDVMAVQKQLMEDMSDVTDRDEANALQQEARSEMLAAVEANGISVDEFNQIVHGMQQDPALSERVQAALGVSQGR